MVRVIEDVESNQECDGSVEIDDMGICSWGKAWNRMNRQGYSVSQLEMIIAESKVEEQLIGASLIWASLTPSEEVFKLAAKLAGANTIDELWEAYYSAGSREGFVAVVLAIVHYELLAEFEGERYYAWIEVKYEGNKYWRVYPK
ncbi:MAG: hypothetical protein ACYTXF_33355 [Nostoc sp.]